MGIVLGVNTVNENLVFGFDTNYGVADNKTSTIFYPGEPTTNLYTNSDFSNGETGWTFASWSSNSVTHTATTVTGPNGNVVSANKLYMGVNGGAVHFHQYNGGKYTSGNTYTTSAWVKGVGTFAIKSHWGGNTNFTMTGDWQRVSMTVTASSSSSSHFPYFAGEGLTVGSDFYITDAQTELKSHATPYVYSGSSNGSRSNTASLIDLEKETNINVGSISFDSTAHPDFDGTNDFLVSSDSILVDGDQSWETVFMAEGAPDSPSGIITNHKFNSSPPSNMGINYVNQNGTYQVGASIGYTDGTREYHTKRANNTIVALNKAYHVVMTYDAGNNRLIWYVNGELDTTHNLSKTPAFSSIQMCSGRWDAAYPDYYFNGKIYVAKVYDKLLTDAEVLQNYKAYKNRFDI